MGISSFTNEEGVHVLTEGRTSFTTGKYYGNDNVHEINDSYLMNVAESRKPLTFHGDHKTPYNYERYVAHVVDDKPSVTRRHIVVGNAPPYETIVDLRIEEYLSRRHAPLTFGPTRADGDSASNQSVVTAMNGIAEHNTQLGVDIADIHKTAHMLSGDASKLAQALLALKRRDVRGFISSLGLDPRSLGKTHGKTLTNYWLEYSYGWKPMVSSIHDTSQILMDKIKKPGGALIGHGHGHSDGSYSGSDDYIVYQSSASISAKTKVVTLVDSPGAHQLNNLGLLNPLSIAWEEVPWSFAIDWFVPVGKILEASTAGIGLNFQGGYTTIQKKQSFSCHANPKQRTENNYFFEDLGSYKEESFSFQRRCFVDQPILGLFANESPFKRNPKTGDVSPRVYNAIALINQLH